MCRIVGLVEIYCHVSGIFRWLDQLPGFQELLHWLLYREVVETGVKIYSIHVNVAAKWISSQGVILFVIIHVAQRIAFKIRT